MFCTQCGKQGAEGAVYCAFCGAKMLARGNGPSEGVAVAVPRPARSSAAKGAFVVCSILLCAVGVFDLGVRRSARQHEYDSGFSENRSGRQDVWEETGIEPEQVIPVVDAALFWAVLLMWLPALIVYVASVRMWGHQARVVDRGRREGQRGKGEG